MGVIHLPDMLSLSPRDHKGRHGRRERGGEGERERLETKERYFALEAKKQKFYAVTCIMSVNY